MGPLLHSSVQGSPPPLLCSGVPSSTLLFRGPLLLSSVQGSPPPLICSGVTSTMSNLQRWLCAPSWLQWTSSEPPLPVFLPQTKNYTPRVCQRPRPVSSRSFSNFSIHLKWSTKQCSIKTTGSSSSLPFHFFLGFSEVGAGLPHLTPTSTHLPCSVLH